MELVYIMHTNLSNHSTSKYQSLFVRLSAFLWRYAPVRHTGTFFEEKKKHFCNVYFEGISYLRTGTFLEVWDCFLPILVRGMQWKNGKLTV